MRGEARRPSEERAIWRVVTCTDVKIVENKRRVDEPSGERAAWRVVTCTYVKAVENKRRFEPSFSIHASRFQNETPPTDRVRDEGSLEG